MKKLSDFKIRDSEEYGFCSFCQEYFIDDIPNYGSILCPNDCGYVVERGIKHLPLRKEN